MVNSFRAADCQTIWATVYFGKLFLMPSVEERRTEIVLFVAWCRRRFLSKDKKKN